MITVNESGEDLIKGEDTITLVDEMKSPLQFDTDSIVVKDKNGNLITGISPKIETTDTGQKMSLTIPDNKKLTITYEATFVMQRQIQISQLTTRHTGLDTVRQ